MWVCFLFFVISCSCEYVIENGDVVWKIEWNDVEFN